MERNRDRWIQADAQKNEPKESKVSKEPKVIVILSIAKNLILNMKNKGITNKDAHHTSS